MGPKFIFPGSFCPPTYGHVDIAKRAAEIFPEVVVVCSRNPQKQGNWFSAEDCAKMWQAYDLPANIQITTLEKMMNQKTDFSELVMIRGIRNDDDYGHEQEVMALNFKQFGIDKYFYLIAPENYRDCSSSRARQAAESLELSELATLVAPLVVTKLLEYVLKAKNVFLVVGRPGSGKSTWLKYVCAADPFALHIDGDDLSRELRPHLEAAFPGEDLYQMALRREAEMLKVLAPQWLELLANHLRQAPEGKNVYIEAAYGLEENKRLYRHVGGKVICVYCADEAHNHQRIDGRQSTKAHHDFVSKIPGWQESLAIARRERLELQLVDTSGSLEQTEQSARQFAARLHQGE